jgi:hypothetical protein
VKNNSIVEESAQRSWITRISRNVWAFFQKWESCWSHQVSLILIRHWSFTR